MSEVFSYTNGYATTEQDLMTAVDSFLTSDIGGWYRLGTVSDTSSNRDYIWRSYGTVSGTYRPVHVRGRAESNILHLYGYLTFSGSNPDDPTEYEGELYDSSYARVPTGSSPFRYWLIGNEDFFQVHVQQSAYYMGYAGLIKTYYLPETDDYPLLIRGQSSSSTYWGSTNSLYMYEPTASGAQNYKSHAERWETSYYLNYDVGLRTQKVCTLPPVIFCDASGKYEVRGEPYGVYKAKNEYIAHQAQMTSVSGTFISFKISSEGYVFGPVSSGTCDLFS